MATAKQIDIEEFFKYNYCNIPQELIDLCVDLYQNSLNDKLYTVSTGLECGDITIKVKRPEEIIGKAVDGYVLCRISTNTRVYETVKYLDNRHWEDKLLHTIFNVICETLTMTKGINL